MENDKQMNTITPNEAPAQEEAQSQTPDTKKKKGKKEKEQLTGWKRVLKEVREWVVSLVVAIIAVFIIKEFIFLPIRVDGSSMYPTLESKERLGVTVYDVKFKDTVALGDVIICNYPGRTNKDPIVHLITMETNFVKRVVGVPGDTVSRKNNVTYINGNPLDPAKENPFFSADILEVIETADENGNAAKAYRISVGGGERTVTDKQIHAYSVNYEYVLGEDEYFVVGDNRYNSHDSRTWNGPLVEKNITNDASGDVGPITKDMIVGHARFAFWPISSIRTVENDTEYVDPRDR
ncbi:MAG: signal peptidase I [Clostridia bacterium]|nr:signal peptidase I [Clostridia bacterium]